MSNNIVDLKEKLKAKEPILLEDIAFINLYSIPANFTTFTTGVTEFYKNLGSATTYDVVLDDLAMAMKEKATLDGYNLSRL